MIKDAHAWEKWENEVALGEPPDFRRNLMLLEAMYQEARTLGRFAWADPLEGLESRIQLARAINVRTPPGTDQS